MAKYTFPLTESRKPQQAGNKAKNLRFLVTKGFQVPHTFICSWKAYENYLVPGNQVLEDLRGELKGKIDQKKLYAVRSSANLEDGLDLSFAGQFQSYLDNQGVEEIINAIQLIWEKTHSPSVETYLDQSESNLPDLKMAVIIQEMSEAKISGVAFSRNPITGLDEVIVEAVHGSGESLVQDGVTPQRWINKWGTWLATPEDEIHEAAIPLELVDEVVRQTKAIASSYRRPVDLEWVFDGQEVNWVQMREITSLDIPVYSNRMSKEVFPGIIKPLVWSINVPLVNGAWIALFTEIIGPNDIQPESLTGRFFCQAYFNISALGKIFTQLGLSEDTLELLLGIEVRGPERPTFKPTSKTYSLLPRIIRFIVDKAFFEHKIDKFLTDMPEKFLALELQSGEDLTGEQLLVRIENLYPLVQQAAYFNNVVALSARLYNRILQRQLENAGLEFDQFDLTGDMDELKQFDPNPHLAQLSQEFQKLPKDVQHRILQLPYRSLSSIPGTEDIQRSFSQFLDQFGHLSDSSSDFSQKPWRETPDLIWQMVLHFTPPASGVSNRTKLSDIKLPLVRKFFFKLIYLRARRYQLHREAISSLYTRGYGLHRDLLLELGLQFKQRSILEDIEDIFFLYYDEVKELVAGSHPEINRKELVKERRDQIKNYKEIIPPETIFGDQAPALETQQDNTGLKGVPTSRGLFTGAVRVMSGLQDMTKIKPGDVLVVPYSDVGWTPLFAKAGAIVAESGGILSHCSIIAREYGIPAVVSVPGACQLADDTQVTVDGHSGKITVH